MSNRKTKEEFIRDAERVHPNEGYTYEKVNYVNNKTKVTITCSKHGDFDMKPNSFLCGQGCPKCGIERNTERQKLSLEEVIRRVREVHGDKYDASQCNYVNALTPALFICKKHGPFYMTPAHIMDGHCCQKCAIEAIRQKTSLGYDEFVRRARKVHGDKYEYNDHNYINNKTPITITCPRHGDFVQKPNWHLNGRGCPSCGCNLSKAENEIYNLVCKLMGKKNVIHNDKKLLDGLEIDVYVPSLNFAIEFNGLRWHTEKFGKGRNYHVDKTIQCEKKGVNLIQIFEDEWIEHKNLVLDKITHALHKDSGKIKIGARKCIIKEVNKDTACAFLDKFHIQGFVGSTKYYGGYYQDNLVGVMSFKEEEKDKWNLTRFSTDYNYAIPGLANKIFKYFINNVDNVKEVKTFLDRRWAWSKVNVYDRMGFTLEKIERPDYNYVKRYERLHKFGFRKQKLSKLYGFSMDMTEREMTEKLGYERIWNCGLIKYVWKNPLFE